MRLLPRVLLLAAVAMVGAYATSSASADDRAAVLVCDIDSAGPSARALDLSGSGGFSAINALDGFEDVDDRSCADVIAALLDDGFTIEEFLALRDDSVTIFALDNND